MAIINTGAVERTITGINESDLFLDESSSSVTNTGAVERELEASHDANFVHPLGDELVVNGGFQNNVDNWAAKSSVISWSNGKLSCDNSSGNPVAGPFQQNVWLDTKIYKVTVTMQLLSGDSNGNIRVLSSSATGGSQSVLITGNELAIGGNAVTQTFYLTPASSDVSIQFACNSSNAVFTIDNVSVKEVLVNRESTVTNTGAVERDIEASHDANFVKPLGDELITNGDFSDGSNGWDNDASLPVDYFSVVNNKLEIENISSSVQVFTSESFNVSANKTYKISLDTIKESGADDFDITLRNSPLSDVVETITSTHQTGELIYYFESASTQSLVFQFTLRDTIKGSIDNVSVKEVLINRESDITNTGVTIRDIEGVNVSDEMFPDNTESSILNVGEEIIPMLNDLESRATYYENEENTINLLKNLNC